MLILGIESSCDETAAAVVEDGRRVLSDVVSSQVPLHARYGGVVPEVASRQHLLQIVPVIEGALNEAEVTLDDIGAIAVTHGPGLAGALMVGINTAKAIAFARSLPLVGVHHLEGHTYAAWLEFDDPATDPGFPLIILIASGAHTDLILMRGHGDYEVLGRTRDDASGEAFDKAARMLGLGFPGGPAVQRAAEGVKPTLTLPRAWLRGSLDFSFSGLKTALLHKAQELGVYPEPEGGADAGRRCRVGGGFSGVGRGRHLGEGGGGGGALRRERSGAGWRGLGQRPAAAGVQGEDIRSGADSGAPPLYGQRGDDRRSGLLLLFQGGVARAGSRRLAEPCPRVKDCVCT